MRAAMGKTLETGRKVSISRYIGMEKKRGG